ncbi:MAG: hypothetical protein HQM16_16435 [Deltaproteobacteria bacterium]|nr:hypothetical protein [Deltaproteobacteria bacterium]
MRIDAASTALTDLKNAPRVSSGQAAQTTEAPKTIGETPPTIVSLSEIGNLAALFSKGGIVSKLKRRLNKLKNKKCRVTPAKGTIACVDADDLVYLGVEFLEEFQNQEDVLAGVMAHEWGHACALKPPTGEMNKLNWNQIFELRRAHEVLADEVSGRMLALMDLKPDGLVNFLLQKTKGTHNLKYHDPETRAEIIKKGFEEEKRKINLAKDLFPSSRGYRNHFHSKIIDDDV